MLIKSERLCHIVKVSVDLSFFNVQSTFILMGLCGLVNTQPDLYLPSLRSRKVHPVYHMSLLGLFLSGTKC